MEDIATFKPEYNEDVMDKISQAEFPVEPQDIKIVIDSHLQFDHNA